MTPSPRRKRSRRVALVLAGATAFGLIVWCASLAFFFLAQAAPAASTVTAEQ